MHIALTVPDTVANGHVECALGFCNCGGKPAKSIASDLPKLTIVLEDPNIM
ncbi:hypothetical protein PITC_014360 [Penicillium italicum]|uniref:Uncharacterized protein n=1 Tax=Penicillium italicum TaxID=40296 RepID=A0A0A2KRF2_PENIT|nr:hypothetical protein PITC_014360 [Penicillium italicum]